MKGSAGGKAMAIISRKEALERYYANPVMCKWCGQVIEVGEDEQACQVKRKTFCNHSCQAHYHNKQRTRTIKIAVCERCGLEIENPRTKNGDFSQKKYCAACKEIIQLEKSTIGTVTKGDLFNKRSGYQSARSCIRRHAQSTYLRYVKQPTCQVCGYDKYVEVCHKKSVSSYSADTLISEINDIDNLIGLCPNCHWEFDNGLLREDQVIREVS